MVSALWLLWFQKSQHSAAIGQGKYNGNKITALAPASTGSKLRLWPYLLPTGFITINAFHTWLDSFRGFSDRKLLTIFAFGIASGYPWVIIGSSLSAWTQDAGFSRGMIGLLGSVGFCYTFNFLWAPLIDRLQLPGLSARFGDRRAWIIASMFLLLVFTLGMAVTGPAVNLWLTGFFGLAIAAAGGTMDLSIDAYRIELFDENDADNISRGAAMATSGWWAGYTFVGGIVFLVHHHTNLDWPMIYVGMACVWPLLMLIALAAHETPPRKIEQAIEGADIPLATAQSNPLVKLVDWLAETVAVPLMEFFKRNGLKLSIALLTFIFLFKFGEAFLGRMSIVFYREIGYSDAQIGIYSKWVTGFVVLLFAPVASILHKQIGLIKGLFIGGILMAATNLLFSAIALAGPQQWLFTVAIIADGCTGAFATVAFVSFLSHLTSHTFTATQYALLASLGNLSRTGLAGGAGFMVDGLNGNWALFFLLTALMVIPSMIALPYIRSMLKARGGAVAKSL